LRELQNGLCWWEAVHPDWTAEDASSQDWGPEVSFYAFDDGEPAGRADLERALS
jgi:hypothetical protein